MFIIDSEPLNGYMLNWNHTNWFISLIIMVVFEVGFICSHNTCPHPPYYPQEPHTVPCKFDTFSSFVFIVNLLSIIFFPHFFFAYSIALHCNFKWYFSLFGLSLKCSIEKFNFSFIVLFISCQFRLNALFGPFNDLKAFTFIYSTTNDSTASLGLKTLWGMIMERFPQYDWFRHLQNYLINF